MIAASSRSMIICITAGLNIQLLCAAADENELDLVCVKETDEHTADTSLRAYPVFCLHVLNRQVYIAAGEMHNNCKKSKRSFE